MKKYLAIIAIALCAMAHASASTKVDDVKFYAMGGGASGQRLYSYIEGRGLANLPTEMYNSNYITALAYDDEHQTLYAGSNTGYLGAAVNGRPMQELERVMQPILALYYESSTQTLWIAGGQNATAVIYKYNVVTRVLTQALQHNGPWFFGALTGTNEAIYASGTDEEVATMIYKYEKSSEQWTRIDIPDRGLTSYGLTVDPTTQVVYVASRNNVYARSGSAWVLIGTFPDAQRVERLIVDKNGKLYAAIWNMDAPASLYTYNDGSWDVVASGIGRAHLSTSIWALAVGADGETVYMAGQDSSDGRNYTGFLYEYNPGHNPSLRAIATNMDPCSDPSRCGMRALAVPGVSTLKSKG